MFAVLRTPQTDLHVVMALATATATQESVDPSRHRKHCIHHIRRVIQLVIIQLGPIPPDNFWIGRNSQTVDRIVIHTMVGTVQSADARFRNPSQEVSAHFGVGLGGQTYQWVDVRDTAYHAGDINWNYRSIGIEHEDDGYPMSLRSNELYGSSGLLVAQLCAQFKIPIDRTHIIGHREIHPTACPDALDIDLIVQLAARSSSADAQEVDMTPAQEAKLDRVLALLEAREPLVWIAREQRALDVETGKPYDNRVPATDPRIAAA